MSGIGNYTSNGFPSLFRPSSFIVDPSCNDVEMQDEQNKCLNEFILTLFASDSPVLSLGIMKAVMDLSKEKKLLLIKWLESDELFSDEKKEALLLIPEGQLPISIFPNTLLKFHFHNKINPVFGLRNSIVTAFSRTFNIYPFPFTIY